MGKIILLLSLAAAMSPGQYFPPSGGGGGGPTTKAYYSSIPPAICVSGVAGFGNNIPSSNAPTPTCINTGTTVLGVLQFAADNAVQSIQFHLELPPDWTSTIDLEAGVRSADSTHAAILNIQTACVGSAALDSPTFNTAQPLTITAGASSVRTVGTLSSLTTTGCSVGNELFVKITADTTTLVSVLELMSLRMTIRRLM